jgi:hypothetical protein
MHKTWQDNLNADALPWLLEEDNPSARYLALRHLLDCAEEDSQAADARAAIHDWAPVQEILALMDPVDFWGRADKPFYGGAVGTNATLSLMAELGLNRTPQIESACENVFEHGQHENGGFSYDGTPGRVLLCHTGGAIRTLLHFGYLGDPRLERALEYLVARATVPGGLACPYADGNDCQWGATKALGAFSDLPDVDRTLERMRAAQALADGVLDHTFDFEEGDSRWLDYGFPLDYQSDLTELCDVLARLGYGTDPRFRRLLDIVLEAQTNQGRWVKRYGTRALRVEKKGKPSKWITIRVLRAIKHTHQTAFEAERTKLL